MTTTKRAASQPRTQSGSRAGYLRSLGPDSGLGTAGLMGTAALLFLALNYLSR